MGKHSPRYNTIHDFINRGSSVEIIQSSLRSCPYMHNDTNRRRCGLVVERQTLEREVGGSILTQVAMLYP